jgi:tetratricopeptide (TPR) repeat protein
MKRWGLRLLLIACLVGALSTWAAALRMRPELEAREASDRLVDEAQEESARGDRDASRQLVEEALKIDAENLRAHRELAMHLIGEGDRDRALRKLQRVAEAKREDPGAARELAALLWTMNDRTGAVRWLREAVRRDPKSGLALVDLAQCLAETGDAAGAIEAAEEAVLLYPRWQAAWQAFVVALRQSGDLAGAREALDRALRLRPHDIGLLMTAADISHGLGQQAAAIDYARRAVAADPQSGLAWYVLGQVLLAAGEEAEAREALARAQSLGVVPSQGNQGPPQGW